MIYDSRPTMLFYIYRARARKCTTAITSEKQEKKALSFRMLDWSRRLLSFSLVEFRKLLYSCVVYRTQIGDFQLQYLVSVLLYKCLSLYKCLALNKCLALYKCRACYKCIALLKCLALYKCLALQVSTSSSV